MIQISPILMQLFDWSRIIINQRKDFILNQIHLIDILHEVSGGIFSTDLERYIQIDIDDMFVGSEGTRIIKSDVDAMIKFQEKWDPVVPGVHFVIGFSGKFFQRSNNTNENQGDEYILGQVPTTVLLTGITRHHVGNRFKKRHLHSGGFLICGVIWNQVDLNLQKYCANI